MKPSVWRGDFPIPKFIRLPGLHIKVKVVPPEEVADFGSKYGCWVYRGPDHENPVAAIYISSSWSVEVQRYILLHELLHAVHDELDQLIEKLPECVQTISMAKMAALKVKEIESGGQ